MRDERYPLRGTLTPVPEFGVRRGQAARRVCRARDCETVLSVYNPGPWCWAHKNTRPHERPRLLRALDGGT